MVESRGDGGYASNSTERPSHEHQTLKETLLYVIDASESMVMNRPQSTTAGEAQSALGVVLEAVLDSIRQQMMVTPNNSVGILFYGVKDQPRGVTVFMPVGRQTSESIKRLMRLQSDVEFRTATIPPASPDQEPEIGNVFYTAGTEIERDHTKAVRRVIWITDNDEPETDAKLKDVARTRSLDLVEKDVTVLPVFVYPPSGADPTDNGRFDPMRYWEDIHLTHKGNATTPDQILAQPVEFLNLLGVVKARHVLKQVAFHSRLLLGQSIAIDVRAYNLYGKRTLPFPSKVYTDGSEQHLASTETKYVVKETGHEASREELTYAFRFGPDLVAVTPEQLDELRNFGEPAIEVLSFRSREDYVNVGSIHHASFIYPHDTWHKGSTRAFVSLWKTMLAKGKIALVSAILRRHSAPVLGLLIPSEEIPYDDNPRLQATPPGLHLVILPYAEDVRELPGELSTPIRSPPAMRKAMDDIVEKLTMPRGYNPHKYRNPRLTWFHEVIEATALSLPMPEAPLDGTEPKYKSINTRAGKLIAEVKRLAADPSSYDNEAAGDEPTKRLKTE